MKTYRLLDEHPVVKKLQKLEDLANELKLSLEFYGSGIIVTDLETNKEYKLKNIESGNVDSFPYAYEQKLTYEK